MTAFLGLLDRLLESAPAEHGAFYTLGEFLYTFQQGKFTESVFILHAAFPRDDCAEVLEQCLDPGGICTLHLHRHHAGTGLTDGAALALKFQILDFSIRADFDPNINFITTGWIVSMHMDAALTVELTMIAWAAGVIEDHLLVKIA
jgi:hypothetical protein